MSAVQNEEYSMADYKAKYNDINVLCDYAEELLATVEHPAVSDQHLQLEVIEPLVNEIADAADVLSEEFLMIAESKKNRAAPKFSKKRIELSLRKIFTVLNEYQAGSKQFAQKAGGVVANVTANIVKKIQQQLDKVVEIFFEFAQISLQSIMNKSELDALKSRNSQLALMMHQFSMSALHSN